MILFPRRPERDLRIPPAATPCRGYFMGNHDLVSDSFLALTGVGLVLLSSSLLAFVLLKENALVRFALLPVKIPFEDETLGNSER